LACFGFVFLGAGYATVCCRCGAKGIETSGRPQRSLVEKNVTDLGLIRITFAKETVQPDPHSPGSALPESAYAADVGYLVDGTPLDAAGNNAVH